MRRKQATPREVLNKELEDVVDAAIRADKYRIFTQRVKNKDAPGYFDVVRNPIDLSVMKGKAKRRAYSNLDDLRADLKQMIHNSV